MILILEKIIFLSFIPVSTMMLGGLIALYYKPSTMLRSAILHFAAGVVFSVVAVELIPDVIKKHDPLFVVIGFALGVLSMLFIRKIVKEKEEHSSEKTNRFSYGMVVGIGVDLFIDGLLLGIGFAAGSTEGILLSIALSIELLSLGLATSSSLATANIPRTKSIALVSLLSLLFLASAVLGGTLLHNLSDSAMELVLSFGLSALLFLVTEELLVEAHEEEESPWLTATFFAGFLLFLILGMIV